LLCHQRFTRDEAICSARPSTKVAECGGKRHGDGNALPRDRERGRGLQWKREFSRPYFDAGARWHAPCY